MLLCFRIETSDKEAKRAGEPCDTYKSQLRFFIIVNLLRPASGGRGLAVSHQAVAELGLITLHFVYHRIDLIHCVLQRAAAVSKYAVDARDS